MSMLHTFLAIFFLVTLVQGISFSSSGEDLSKKHGHDKNIVFKSYHITLIPDIEGANFTFYGESVINILFLHDTQEIALHFKNLELIPEIGIRCNNTYNNYGKIIPPHDTDIFPITFPKIIGSSLCNFTIKYRGQDNGENRGFYRTSYIDDNGNQKWIASTHLEPIGARQVFPCWDEPAAKAKFTISIKHSRKYTALSNMPVKSSEVDNENLAMITTHFVESPTMSTYLVAFALGDFVPVDSYNLNFQVFTRKDVYNQGKYALKIGPKILETLGNYINYPYEKMFFHNFTKMDSLAVPTLSAGAMENWGLVIYTEKEFLFAENLNTTLQKENVLGIMAHEFAHQWFGNLVTAAWWDDIWLNEGFANYFQYFITNQIEPTWRMMDRFVVENLQETAFVADSKTSSHAMSQKRESDKEIMDAFDNITYSKSGSIIRMISHVVGEENFQTALQNYIQKKAFGSANSNDLFKELTDVHKDNNKLMEILENWINVVGYPVIKIERHPNSKNKVIITQTRFWDENNRTSAEKYWIPLNYVTEDNLNFTDTKVSHWIDPKDNSTEISLTSEKFFIFNKQQFGYYRVNYDDKNWQRITDYLKTKNHTDIHVLNRAQLIDDALNLAKVGKLSYSIALSLIGYLKAETDYIPWSAAWRGIEHINRFVANTELAPVFKEYILGLSEKLVEQVQSVKENETDHIMKHKRIQALTWACALGSFSHQSEALKKLIKWLENPKENVFPPDDADWMMCAGMRTVDGPTWHKVWNIYLNEKDKRILTALGCTPNPEILKAYLHFMKPNNTEIFPEIIRAIYTGSSTGINTALDYMIENHAEIIKFNGYSSDQWKSDFTLIVQRLTNDNQREKLRKYMETADKQLKDVLKNALEIIDSNLEIIQRHLVQFKLYFKKDTTSQSGNSAIVFELTTIVLLASFIVSQIY